MLTKVTAPAEMSDSVLSLSNEMSLTPSASVPNSAATSGGQPTASPFVVGDLVQICSDVERVKVFQRGHGEWAEAMLPVRAQISLSFAHS